METLKFIFFHSRGLRAGWRLLIFVGMVVGLTVLAHVLFTNALHIQERPDLDPIGTIFEELVALVNVLIATSIMARIERRKFTDYGIPMRNPFGREFWAGVGYGLGSTSVIIGMIAAFGGYRIPGLAIHGGPIWYFALLWLVASLLIGVAEELEFRAYLLATLSDGIGFWPAAVLISIGFGALHYFFKPHERWEDFAATGLLGLFTCLTVRRTGTLAFVIGFHAAYDFANLFVWSGQNGGDYAIGHLLDAKWQGAQWLTGGMLGPEASWFALGVTLLMFGVFDRHYREKKFPPAEF